MPIALVSKTIAAPAAVTGAIDTTGANLLVAAVSSLGVPISAVSDSKGNTWTPLTSRTDGTSLLQIFWSIPTTVGTGHTFSASTSFGTLWFGAFSGANTSPYESESGAAIAANSGQPGSLTAAEDGDLFITAGVTFQSGSDAVDSGFATDLVDYVFNGPMGGGAGYLIQGSAAPVNPTWSWVGQPTGVLALAVFKPVPGIVHRTLSFAATAGVHGLAASLATVAPPGRTLSFAATAGDDDLAASLIRTGAPGAAIQTAVTGRGVLGQPRGRGVQSR